MGCGVIGFAGVAIVISSALELSSAVHDSARQNIQKDWKNNCPLDAKSVNPWLVKIWDADYGQTMSHGSILAHQVVLSTCASFIDADERISQYLIVGQNVHSTHDPREKCIQSRKVKRIIKHPACSREEALNAEPRSTEFVNLAIWILKGHFDTENDFPTLNLHSFNPTSAFLDDLQKLEASPDAPGCGLPTFNSREEMDSDSPKDASVTLIPFSKDCVAMLCEGAENEEDCISSNVAAEQGSRMCVVPKWRKKFSEPGEVNPSVGWHNGSPLICDKVAFGISTRMITSSKSNQDFFLITTFLEHNAWLTKTIEKFESLPKEEEYHKFGIDTTTRDPSRLIIDPNDYVEETTHGSQKSRKSRAATVYHHLRPIFFISAFTISFRLCWRG